MLVGRNVFSVLYPLSFSYNQAQLSPNVPKYFFLEESCRMLSGYQKVFTGNAIVMCLESFPIEQRNAHSQFDGYLIF